MREHEETKMLVLLNFSSSDAQTDIGVNIANAKLLLSNYKDAPLNSKEKKQITLRPYEAIIYRL